jgi:hypothetical protein
MSSNYIPDISQDTLRNLWKGGPSGRLSAWEVAKALAFREASKVVHNGQVKLPWISTHLTKIPEEGKNNGESPGTSALHELFAKIDADPDWFPGKHTGAKRGPKPLFNAAKRRCVATSFMSRKKNLGEQPCVQAAILNCPKATRNPKTKRPFCEKTIMDVCTKECYDFDPEKPWRFQQLAENLLAR